MKRTSLALVLCCLMAACGKDEGSGSVDPVIDANTRTLQSIVVAPSSITLLAYDGVTPATHQFRLVGNYDDGTMEDLTDEAVWISFDPSLVSVDGNGLAFTSTHLGGVTSLRATVSGREATSQVTVYQRFTQKNEGVEDDVIETFDKAIVDTSAGRAPKLEYPDDRIAIPPNFPGLEFHFTKGTDNSVWQLTITTPGSYYQMLVYGKCKAVGQGCYLVPNDAIWQFIETYFKGVDVIVTVAGLNEVDDPPSKGISVHRTIHLTDRRLDAGLYYWAATDGRIHRFDFGHAGVPPEAWYPDGASTNCAACHALSRDGSLIALDRGSPVGTEGYLMEVLDVATKTQLWGSQWGSGYHAFSPDNKYMLTTTPIGDLGGLSLVDAVTGEDLAIAVHPEGSPSLPDWSPDGSMVVYTSSGSLWIVSWDEPTTSFSAPTLLVNGSDYTNPAFTPDSKFVLFNSYDDAWNQSIFYVPVDGSWGSPNEIEPVRVTKAITESATYNSWPKMAPDIETFAGGNKVAFFTWSTRRPIGLRPDTGISQIWMSAFATAEAKPDKDPSYPAVHMPWQATSHGNHIAQWVIDIPHEPCGPMGECPEEHSCIEGECLPFIP